MISGALLGRPAAAVRSAGDAAGFLRFGSAAASAGVRGSLAAGDDKRLADLDFVFRRRQMVGVDDRPLRGAVFTREIADRLPGTHDDAFARPGRRRWS